MRDPPEAKDLSDKEDLLSVLTSEVVTIVTLEGTTAVPGIQWTPKTCGRATQSPRERNDTALSALAGQHAA